MLSDQNVEMDMHEMVEFIQLYRFSCMVWEPRECPLKELNNYAWRGDEELVVVCHSTDTFYPHRLVHFEDALDLDNDSKKHFITFKFHAEWHVHIIFKTYEGNDN